MEKAGERLGTTEVNAFELAVSAFPDGRRDSVKLAQVQRVLDRLDVLILDRKGALRAAELVSKLRARGRTVGVLDALVAGIALESGYNTIVTRDEDFRRIPGMKVETY